MAFYKPIDGYEELYLISDEGDVISLPRTVISGDKVIHRKQKSLKTFLRGRDDLLYEGVCLCKDGTEKRVSVHRLVADAFVDNPDPDHLTVVNHKDRNPLNNKASNLEWCDQQYNNEYSHNRRVAQFLKGEKIAEYKSISYASEITGVSRRSINNALCGWAKTAGGFEWFYV